MFPVTSLFALPYLALFILLWFPIVRLRRQSGILLGHGQNPELEVRIRRHGNFIEWVPFLMVLMMLAEGQGAPVALLWAAGALGVFGRALHPFSLSVARPSTGLRVLGNVTCLIAAVLLGGALIFSHLLPSQ